MNITSVISKKSFSYTWSYSRWKEDFALLFTLFLLSIVFVYYLPRSLSNIFFLGLLFLFFRSEKNYFWFAYFFIIVQGPGYFFTDFYAGAQYRLPMYTFLPGTSVTPLDLFVILALLKAILKGKKMRLKLKKPLIFIFVYIIFSLFITFIHCTDLQTLTANLRGSFYYSIIISFLYLINKRKEAYYFIYLIIPFVFFLLFTQLYFLITRNEFINLFYPGYRRLVLMESGVLRPIMGGVLLLFFSFIFSLFLLENKENKLSKKYLYLIIALAYFSIIMSATRIWFVVFTFILFGYIIISKKKISNSIKIFSVLFILIISLLLSGIISSDFLVKGSGKRFSKILNIAEGDFHSDSSFEKRYFFRLPRLLEGLKKYIIFGCGFSKNGLEYLDYHVGFFNTILQFGIIGFSFFLYFYVSYFNMINTAVKKLNKNNSLKTPLKIFALIFGGILLANFTTWFFFPMTDNISIPFFIAVFLSLTDLFVREAEKEELLLSGEKHSRY